MNIEKMLENLQEPEELKAYIGSQYKQIIQLTKKNKELEDKNLGLTKQLRIQDKNELTIVDLTINPDVKILDDAKTIAQIQLRMLKEVAFDKELTLEEAKRVEIFNRILNEEKKDDKGTLKANAKVLNESDLLKLADGL